MNIAIWGFGPYGQNIYRILERLFSAYKVTRLFDRDPAAISPAQLPAGMELLPVTALREEYAHGAFEGVLVGIYRPQIREDVERQLADWQVPTVNWQALCDSLAAEAAVLSEDAERRFADWDFSSASRAALMASMKAWITAITEGRSSLDGGTGQPVPQVVADILVRLRDRESAELFFTRLNMAMSGNESGFLRTVERYGEGRRYYIHELTEPMARCGAQRAILFGGGADGAVNRHALQLGGIPIAACCSLTPDKARADWPGAAPELCIGPERLSDPAFDDCIVIVSSSEERTRIWECLRQLAFPPERVFDPPAWYRPLLVGFRPGQYFDIWKPREHETFVDCGAYNGLTLSDFSAWCGGRYDAIYALEPLPEMQEVLLRRQAEEGLHDLTLYAAAAWSGEETLCFVLEKDASSSNVSSWAAPAEHTISVRGAALDDLIDGPVSFIKMDIEGSEMAAIEGAQRLIRSYRPRLAISVYHRDFDVLDLPHRILELVPEYRFRFRHYSAGLYETVLYASVDPED